MNTLKRLILWVLGIILAVAIITTDSKAYLLEEVRKDGKKVWVLYKQVLLENINYEPLILRLNSAKEGEVIYIEVRKNFGGAVPTMNLISYAIHNSKAKVVISVRGWAASAGAHILLQGDVALIPSKAMLLWHTGSVCWGPGKCVRITPGFVPWYLQSIYNQRYLYPVNIVCTRPGSCTDLRKIKISIPLPTRWGIYWKTYQITPPGDRKYVSQEYWDFFLTGYDKWATGYEVCRWNLGDISFRDKREKYIGEGCKLVGVKGQNNG